MIYKLLILLHLIGPHGLLHKKTSFKDVEKSDCLVWHDRFEIQCDSSGVKI